MGQHDPFHELSTTLTLLLLLLLVVVVMLPAAGRC
jgi:hypothetical protein